MVINTNFSALTASTLLGQSTTRLEQSLKRLSSGSKIISPADDSAGLAVSMRLGAKLGRLNAAIGNLENAISLEQTRDGYLQKVDDALTRMGELAMLSLDVTKTDNDRANYNQEYTALGKSVFDVSHKAFNGVSLFDGSTLNTPIDEEGNTFLLAGFDLSKNIGNVTYFYAFNNTVGSWNAAHTALNDLRRAVKQLASDRGRLGADMARLNYHHDQLASLRDGLTAARSRISDVDVAEESTRFAKYNILAQAGTAMLAQANSLPQTVLKLLG